MPADLGKVFLGTHRHRLDSKQRVTLPADYRRIVSALEEGSEHEAFGIALAADRSHLIILPLQSLFSQAAKGGAFDRCTQGCAFLRSFFLRCSGTHDFVSGTYFSTGPDGQGKPGTRDCRSLRPYRNLAEENLG